MDGDAALNHVTGRGGQRRRTHSLCLSLAACPAGPTACAGVVASCLRGGASSSSSAFPTVIALRPHLDPSSGALSATQL
jgi:hypothetical protein